MVLLLWILLIHSTIIANPVNDSWVEKKLRDKRVFVKWDSLPFWWSVIDFVMWNEKIFFVMWNDKSRKANIHHFYLSSAKKVWIKCLLPICWIIVKTMIYVPFPNQSKEIRIGQQQKIWNISAKIPQKAKLWTKSVRSSVPRIPRSFEYVGSAVCSVGCW